MGQVLTKKQEAFVLAYIQHPDLNASAAYRTAYGAKRMTAKTVNEAASRLLANSKVAARVAELRAPALAAASMSVERTLRELACVAYADPRRLFGQDGRGKRLDELDRDTAAALAQVDLDDDGRIIGFRFCDKNAALGMAMKHHGLFERDNSQRGANLALQVVLVGAPQVEPGASVNRELPRIEVETR